MKDHPKPTKEQMEAAEKVAQSSDHCEGGPVAEGYGDGCDCCDRYIGIQAEHIAKAFARREAQAYEQGRTDEALVEVKCRAKWRNAVEAQAIREGAEKVSAAVGATDLLYDEGEPGHFCEEQKMECVTAARKALEDL